MPAFEYRAQDANGRNCRGLQEADSARHARQLLRERGLRLSHLGAVRKNRQGASHAQSGIRLGASELALLTRQLSTLIHAGLPLDEALLAVSAQSEKRRLSQLLAAVRSRVLEGHTLAAALSAFPKAFTELFRATVAAGERSGHLGHVLEQLADYSEARQASHQKIQLALVYPLILLVASLSIVGFLLGYVVPDVVKIFINSGQPLPVLTRAMIAISDGLRSHGGLLLMVLLAACGAVRWALRQPRLKLRWHVLLLNLPLAGGVVRAMEAARFASTLAILGKSAVPLVDALEIAATVISNLAIRRRMLDVARSVREGGTLARGLERSGDIPPMMLHLIASGERAGELDSWTACWRGPPSNRKKPWRRESRWS